MLENTDQPGPSAENAAPPIPAETGPNEATFSPLDPGVVWLWRFSSAIGWAFLLAATLAFAVGIGGFVWHHMAWSLTTWAGLCCFALFWLFYYPRRALAAWGYRLNDNVLEIKSGVWFRVVRLLPLSRLQHVDLERGPLERSLGLASLVLYTAGTQEAAITIPGLTDATAVHLRDTLVNSGGDDGV